MTKPAIDKPVRRPAILTPYAALWSTLGTLGLVYLGVAVFQPDWLSSLTPASARIEHSAETQATLMKLSADVDGLKSSMANLQLDVSGVKSDVENQAQHTQALGSQVTALEDKMRLAEAPPAPLASAAAPQQHTGTDVIGAADDTPAGLDLSSDQARPQTKIINASPERSQIVTGSVDKSPAHAKPKASAANSDEISFGPAVVKPVKKPIGIALASSASVEGLRLNWSQLAQQHGDKLKKLKARYTTNGDPANPSFNLIAGPVKTKAEAVKICNDLQAQAVSCSVEDFTGNAL
jgi:hypothetical protein